MDEAAIHREASSVLTEIPRYGPEVATPVAPARVHVPAINVALFLITLLTTTMAGGYAAGATFSILHPLASIHALVLGLSFSIPLMSILLAHEMGHTSPAGAAASIQACLTSCPRHFLPSSSPEPSARSSGCERCRARGA